MKREQLIPLIDLQKSGKMKQVTLQLKNGDTLLDYRVSDVGEIYLHGNGPGNGQSPIRLSAIKSVSWTEEKRCHISEEA